MPPKIQNPPGQGKSRSARRRRARKLRIGPNTVRAPPSGNPAFAKPVREPRAYGNVLSKRYAAVLDDPFSNEPIKLGFGTLVDTKIGVSRISTTVTANADGSLTLIGNPRAQSPLSYNSAGLSTSPLTLWTSVTDGNWGSMNGEFISARPIALGLKVTPIISANDAISRAVSGTISYDVADDAGGAVLNAFNNNTCNDWFGSHLGSKCIATAGNSFVQTWRPMGLRNFDFDVCFLRNEPTVSSSVVFTYTGPVVFMAIQGVASKQYDVELIYYFEGLPQISTSYPGANPLSGESPVSSFPSMESFYRSAQQYLNPENVGRVASAASTASTLWRQYASDRLIPLLHSMENVSEREEEDDDHRHVNSSPESDRPSTRSRRRL